MKFVSKNLFTVLPNILLYLFLNVSLEANENIFGLLKKKKALIITKIGLTCFCFFRMEFVAKKVYCVWMKKNGPSSCSTCFFSYDGLFMNANDYTMHH
jgi:hypothetical protein